MSIKPYIKYGIGVQKKIKDNFTAWGQAMILNGGRNGLSLTLGFRWTIGKDSKEMVKTPAQKVVKTSINADSNVQTKDSIKVLKQLTPNQKAYMSRTTRTQMSADIKKI